MENSDYPAMPLPGDAYQDFAAYDPDKNGSSYNPECQGLTKREHFAAVAMQALASAHSSDGTWSHDPKDAASAAVQYADALLEELAK